MKKLKIALSLIFALTFSLFLVACGGGNKEVTDIELEGMTTEFKEGEAFTTGDLVVTVYYRGSDEPVVLEAGQYEVDSSAYNAESAGTYQIIITPEQTPAEGAQPVTRSYEVTVDHNWTDNGDGTFTCQCGAKRESFSGLTDTIETTAWGNPATLTEVSEQSPATAPIAGENHVSYGSLVAGQSKALTLKILTVDTGSAWNTPLMGIRNGADGVLPREDNWVIATAAGFVAPWGTSTGYSASIGTATTASTEWEVFTRGTSWTAADIEGGTIVVTYDYSLDSIMTIRHALTKADGTEIELIYSIKLPDAAYEIVAYGEKCTYQVTNIESVMNREVTGLTATPPTATVQPEGKMFDTAGITTEASMSAGSPVVNSYNAYAYINVVTANEDGTTTTTPTRVNLSTEPLQAGMYDFNVEFAGKSYYFTSDGTADGTDLITVIPSEFTAVGTSAVSKDGVVFDAPNVSFDYAVDDAEEGIVINGSGQAGMLTEKQQAALDTDSSAFVAFKISSLAEGVTAVSVNGGYAALNGSVIDVVLPLGSSYTLTISAGETVVQEATIDLSAVTAPTAGAYIAESDFTLDAGGTYTVVYTGLSNVGSLQLFTGGVRDTVKEVQDAIAADGQYTALNGQLYINSVEETAEGLVVVYEVAPPQIVNLSASNAFRSVEVRDADGETLVAQTLYYNMTFSEKPSGSYAKIGDNTVVYVSRDMMYVIKGVTGESVDGNLEYIDLFIDATLNIQNKVGESFNVSVSTSADGTVADASNVITSSVDSTAKVVSIGNVNDTTDYDYGALIMYQFSVTLLDLRTEDNAATYYFTANEDTKNGQETYTVYTVTGNEIEAKKVTPTGERSEMQAFSCVQDGINAYTDEETGFVYGAIVTPATGVHTWGEEVDGVATCSVCQATKSKVTIDENSYYEVVLLSAASSEIVPNTDPTGTWWDSSAIGAKTVSGDFVVQYTWENTRDPNWYQDAVIEITDGTTVFDMNFFVSSGAWGDMTHGGVTNVSTTLNGAAATLPAQPTTDSFAGDYTAKIERFGDTVTITQTAVLESGDVWVVVDEIAGFTTAPVTTQITGNPFWLDDIRVTVATLTKVIDVEGDSNNQTIGAIANAAETGISVSATILGHSGDWGTVVIRPSSGMLVTLPNLDPFANTVGFPATNCYPSWQPDYLVGEGANWDSFFNATTPYYLTISISNEDGVKYYRDGELMIQYYANGTLSNGTSYVYEFVEILLDDIAENGFTFMSATAEGATTTDLHIQGAVSDAEALALYQAQAE